MHKQTTFIKSNQKLKQDNVFVESELVSLEELTGKPVRKGLEKALISEGQIVNIVSKGYGHLPNEKFFTEVESNLINADVYYKTSSVNRDNRSFAVDYILEDEKHHIHVKNDQDKLKAMLRFVNSYDGSCKTSGYFGIFRQVCTNGLHTTHSQIGFSFKHKGDIVELVLPEIGELIRQFVENEFYTLQNKFTVLAETPIKNIEDFVKYTLGKTGLFQYEASEKNTDPSLNARIVMDTIQGESDLLGQQPNLWLGYNAFNEILHGKLKKTFEQQRILDGKLFDTILTMAN